MKKKFVGAIIIIACFAAIFSCSNTGSEDVVYTLASPENYKFINETIAVSYEIIQPNASCEDSYLSDISKAIEYKGHLYIMAAENTSIVKTSTIFIFTDKGEFVKRFSTGRGPGEFISAGGFTIDRENDVLEVFSMLSIYRYTLAGDFIEKIDLPKKIYLGFENINGNYFLHTPRITKNNNHYYHLYNPADNSIESYFQGVELPLGQSCAIYYGEDGTLLFNNPYSGTFYTLNDSLKTERVFRFEPFVPDEMLMTPYSNNPSDKNQFDGLFKGYYSSIKLLSGIGDNLLSLRSSYEQKGKNILFDKRNGDTYYGIFEDAWYMRLLCADSQWHYYTISPSYLEKFVQFEFHSDIARKLVEELGDILNQDPDGEGNPIIIKVRYE